MPLSEKQKHRVEGILAYINDFLDKRFAQARRVNTKVAMVEPDLRWHQIGTLRLVLSATKSFGTLKLVVADILSSADETKKRDVFHPDNQASIMNEIIPMEDDFKKKEKRVGQLEINDIKTLYKALDPSLEKIVELLQCWIWWDIRDASELFRFDEQAHKIDALNTQEIDSALREHYQKEMGLKPEVDVSREQMIMLEMARAKEIVERFQLRVRDESGYQAIIVSSEKEGSPEADALCMRLAKRLAAVEKLRVQNPIDENVRNYYAQQMGLPTEQVGSDAVIEFEQKHIRIDRQALLEKLNATSSLGESFNYKQIKLDDLKQRFVDLCNLVNLTPEEVGRKPVEEGKKEN